MSSGFDNGNNEDEVLALDVAVPKPMNHPALNKLLCAIANGTSHRCKGAGGRACSRQDHSGFSDPSGSLSNLRMEVPVEVVALVRIVDVGQLYDKHNTMRYPDGHKESVGARIVETTSRALRKDGIDGVSIPRLMRLAGLTHGGFYAHFKDRDDLIAKAALHAAHASVLRDDQPAAKSLERYLSKEHVLHPELGCVVAALGAEGARQKGPLRRAFSEIGRGFLRLVERNLHPEASAKGGLSDEALATASRMVGAIMLARLVDDDGLAERILAAAKLS